MKLAADPATSTLPKLLRRNVSKEDNERLIREVVSSLDSTARPN